MALTDDPRTMTDAELALRVEEIPARIADMRKRKNPSQKLKAMLEERALQELEGIRSEIERRRLESCAYDEFLTDGIPIGLEDEVSRRPAHSSDFIRFIRELPAQVAVDRLTLKGDKPQIKQPDGNHFRCPWPGHVDQHPSAWINRDKRVWTCGPCGFAGGDWWELAAAARGYTRPGFKIKDDPAAFALLADELRREFGWREPGAATDEELQAAREGRLRAGRRATSAEAEALEQAALAVLEGHPSEHLLPVEHESSDPEDELPSVPPVAIFEAHDTDDHADHEKEASGAFPTFDLATVLPKPDTFLARFYEQLDRTDSPSEFGLWCGLAALSVIVGRRTVLLDEPDVTANLAICLTAETTVGKSRALRYVREILGDVEPYKAETPTSGVRLIKNPASGEFLVSEFMAAEYDPTDTRRNPTPVRFHPVRALVEYDELATVAGKSDTAGSSLKPRIMDFVDGRDPIESGSLKNGLLSAKGAFATIVTTTQPDSIKHLFKRADATSGLLNRFVFATGRPKVKRHRIKYKLDFGPSKAELEAVRGWLPTVPAIDWSDDADRVWKEVHRDVVVPTQQANNEFLGRLDLLLKRLMLLFAVNDRSSEVLGAHVLQAAGLISYVRECFEILADSFDRSEAAVFEQKVLGAIERYERSTTPTAMYGPTCREINRQGFRGRGETGQIQRCLDALVKSDLVVRELRQTGPRGRAATRYRLNR